MENKTKLFIKILLGIWGGFGMIALFVLGFVWILTGNTIYIFGIVSDRFLALIITAAFSLIGLWAMIDLDNIN